MQTPHPNKTLKKNPKKPERERRRGKCATSNASPESQEPNQSYTNHTTKKQNKKFFKCQRDCRVRASSSALEHYCTPCLDEDHSEQTTRFG